MTTNDINKNDAEKVIIQTIKQFLGEYGMAKANMKFMKDWVNNKGIIKVNNKETPKVKAALTLIKEINDEKAIVKSVGVSGTLNKARLKYLKEAK
ncbi:ribonuclease P protein component 2 [Candidatus Woesearchaeota archaeon]|nr:MAG: ribonuclease P protein component 2 [Candidatus Woesearchaeota archaeon]